MSLLEVDALGVDQEGEAGAFAVDAADSAFFEEAVDGEGGGFADMEAGGEEEVEEGARRR